jgi:hypothetical protein
VKEGGVADEGGAPAVRPRPGWCCNSDGSRMPLGPRVEFRVIDYGSSCFSSTLAEATGGFRSRENYERLSEMFQGRHVMLRSATQVRRQPTPPPHPRTSTALCRRTRPSC